MAYRIPRGHNVNRPPYQELQEGVRPELSAVPSEAWTGLPPVRVDEIHHDPIVIDAGTLVGIATGGRAIGKMFPAHGVTGSIHLASTADDTTNWGIVDSGTVTAAVLTGGPVLPLGVCYQPIYSFNLQNAFINYKRNDNVGIVTDYVIQVPAITAREHLIKDGEMVMVSKFGGDTASLGAVAQYGRVGEVADVDNLIGRFERYDDTAANLKYVVGRCLKSITFATGTADTRLSTDYASISLSTAGSAEFKGLDKVQTVPGLAVAGSGTSGTPGWLGGGYSDGSGNYKMLNILIRL